jgi:mRNA-degrading endonuclease toxin of MazEF toxin-antitoxin module
MKPGDIWLFPFPFTSVDSFKKRPSLVLHVEPSLLVLARATAEDALLLAISSVVTYKGPNDIVFPDTDPAFERSGLRKSSLFKIPKLFTLKTSLGLRQLGELSPEWMERVRAAVRNCI